MSKCGVSSRRPYPPNAMTLHWAETSVGERLTTVQNHFAIAPDDEAADQVSHGDEGLSIQCTVHDPLTDGATLLG